MAEKRTLRVFLDDSHSKFHEITIDENTTYKKCLEKLAGPVAKQSGKSGSVSFTISVVDAHTGDEIGNLAEAVLAPFETDCQLCESGLEFQYVCKADSAAMSVDVPSENADDEPSDSGESSAPSSSSSDSPKSSSVEDYTEDSTTDGVENAAQAPSGGDVSGSESESKEGVPVGGPPGEAGEFSSSDSESESEPAASDDGEPSASPDERKSETDDHDAPASDQSAAASSSESYQEESSHGGSTGHQSTHESSSHSTGPTGSAQSSVASSSPSTSPSSSGASTSDDEEGEASAADGEGDNSGAGERACRKCSKPIHGSCVTAMGAPWHPDCFVCFGCSAALNIFGAYDDVSGKPYCSTCAPGEREKLSGEGAKPPKEKDSGEAAVAAAAATSAKTTDDTTNDGIDQYASEVSSATDASGSASSATAPDEEADDKGTSEAAVAEAAVADADQEIVTMIADFLVNKPDRCAGSVEIMQHFRNRVQREQSQQFTRVLAEVCRFEKSSRSWVLNPDVAERHLAAAAAAAAAAVTSGEAEDSEPPRPGPTASTDSRPSKGKSHHRHKSEASDGAAGADQASSQADIPKAGRRLIEAAARARECLVDSSIDEASRVEARSKLAKAQKKVTQLFSNAIDAADSRDQAKPLKSAAKRISHGCRKLDSLLGASVDPASNVVVDVQMAQVGFTDLVAVVKEAFEVMESPANGAGDGAGSTAAGSEGATPGRGRQSSVSSKIQLQIVIPSINTTHKLRIGSTITGQQAVGIIAAELARSGTLAGIDAKRDFALFTKDGRDQIPATAAVSDYCRDGAEVQFKRRRDRQRGKKGAAGESAGAAGSRHKSKKRDDGGGDVDSGRANRAAREAHEIELAKWVAATTNEGREYYYHVETLETRWELPQMPGESGGSAAAHGGSRRERGERNKRHERSAHGGGGGGAAASPRSPRHKSGPDMELAAQRAAELAEKQRLANQLKATKMVLVGSIGQLTVKIKQGTSGPNVLPEDQVASLRQELAQKQQELADLDQVIKREEGEVAKARAMLDGAASLIHSEKAGGMALVSLKRAQHTAKKVGGIDQAIPSLDDALAARRRHHGEEGAAAAVSSAGGGAKANKKYRRKDRDAGAGGAKRRNKKPNAAREKGRREATTDQGGATSQSKPQQQQLKRPAFVRHASLGTMMARVEDEQGRKAAASAAIGNRKPKDRRESSGTDVDSNE